MTAAGALSILSLFLMSPKKSKPQKALNGSTPPAIIPSEDDEELPEIDLISFDEPEAVADLGDFSAVWQYLASQREPTRPSNLTENPASRRQFLKKAESVQNTVKTNILSIRNIKSKLSSQPARQKTKKITKSEISKVKSTSKPTFTSYSSPEDDPEESAWYSSSYEDKHHPFAYPRRNSFLYVPPSFSSPYIPPKPTSILPAAPLAADRRRNLIQKLIQKYPEGVNRILVPQSNSPSNGQSCLSSLTTLQSPDLQIFIDNSNILIGFYDTYKSKHKITGPYFRPPKFDFHAFSTILERGRPVSRKILVGSNPLTQPVSLAQHLGYEVSILERVVDNKRIVSAGGNPYESDSKTRTPQKKKEQAVDEILHLKILECLLDVEKPGTIVLATGDAAPAEFSPEGGFLKCIKRALTRGWFVELVCWRRSMSRLWRDKLFRVEWRDTFSVVELDDFIDELVLE